DPTPLNGTSPTGCNGGDVCSGVEVCKNGSCASGTPLDCGICTACDPVSGCEQQPIPNCCLGVQDCNDGNDSTSDSCVDSRCVHDLIPNCCDTNADCDDGNPCTADSACMTHRCTHTPLSGPEAGCGDGLCSDQAHCESGTCVAPPIVCADDGDFCTTDFC